MKKFLALAALVLGMVSCQQDYAGLDVDANGEAAVTVSVAIPEMETRAGGNDSAEGAFGNIDLTKYDVRYILEVYDHNGALAKERLTNYEDEGQTTAFNLRLIPGRAYRFVVWADFVLEGKKEDLHYDTENLRKIEVIPTNWALSDESRDAYTGYHVEAEFSNSAPISIELKRPLGKLRVVTTDVKDMYKLLPKEVKVEYTSEIYTVFNAYESDVDLNSKVAIAGKAGVEISKSKYAGEWNGDVVKEGLTLFTDYFFAANDAEPINFTLDVTDTSDLPIPQVVFNTPIPIQRNYLTTVTGPILTDSGNITVEIKDAFEGAYSQVETTASFADALKEAEGCVDATIDLTGDVTWVTGAGIGSTPLIPEGAITETLTINGNGHKVIATGSGVGQIRMANGGKLIFNNVKFVDESVSYAENSWEYGYLEFGGELVFNECQFVNAVMMSGEEATFNKCTFNSNKNNEYAVWVDNGNASFDECAFKGPRAIKVHEAYGSEVGEVVVDNSTFTNIAQKPGMAIGDVNADTAITIQNSTFTNCQAGDQGLYIYETDTDVTSFTFIEEGNSVSAPVATQEALEKLLKSDFEEINVALEADAQINVSNAYIQLGGTHTKRIVIDGKKLASAAATGAAKDNHKLTLATTYWSRLNTVNPNAVIVLKNLSLTSSQETGTWNSYDVTFQCNVELENVELLKAVAFDGDGKSVKVKNVTIKESHDYYAMWISAVGQTVDIENLVIESAGRGIKIDEQYVGTPAKVTLNVKNATFKTAKKAAIVVKSAAGADIALENVNIANVAADPAFAVWVDEDAAAYADLVNVTGGLKKVEGSKSGVIAGSQSDFAEAVGNSETATIVLNAGTYTMPSTGGKDLTIIGDKDVIINAGAANMGDGNVTLEGVTITAGLYKGFQHSGVVTYNNVTIKGQLNCYGKEDIFNGCTFELDNAYVWTYGSDKTVFNNCTFNTNGKAILIYNEGAGACDVEVKNCTFNATVGAKAGAIANQNCAAIEIDNFKKMAHKLTTSGNTINGDFSGEWRIKSYVEGAPVTVNGVEYTYIALDGKKMTIDGDKNVTVVE